MKFIRDRFGNYVNTSLHLAVYWGKTEALKALLKAGAHVNKADNDSRTPLHLAADYGHLDIVKALVKAGAKPNQADNNSQTPLHEAAEGGHLDIVKALLEYDANPNQANNNRQTPLHLAAMYGYTETVKALLKAGAHVNKDNLLEFIKRGWKDIIKLAFIHNEDLLSQCRDIKSDYGKEPIVQKAIAEIDKARIALDKNSPFERVDGFCGGLAGLINSFLSFSDAYNLSITSK